MTPFDDDMDVSGNDLPDIVTMAMARRTLRGLIPAAPPEPSEQLATVLREGLVVSGHRSGWARLTGRLASLGLAAKLMLAAGVAVASAGGAATAVAFTHENHHADHPDSPRNHPVIVVPGADAGTRNDDGPRPVGHPTTDTTREAESHGGTDGTSGHDSTSGHDDGSGSHDGGSGSGDSTSGSDGGGSGSGDSTSGSDGGGSGSTSDGGTSGSGSTSGDTSGSGSGDSGSGSGSSTDGGSSGGTSDGGSGSSTSDGGSSGG